MESVMTSLEVTCAVEVFLAVALLHRENPARPEFTIQEIVDRAEKEGIAGTMRPGIRVHASEHCVANKPPSPGKHKMLAATGKRTRRLLLPSDEVHPGRTGKIFPDAGEIPERYLQLLEWAKKRYEEDGSVAGGRRPGGDQRPGGASSAPTKTADQWLGSLLEMEGLGKEYWKDVDPDEFVRQLREGWE